LGGGDGDDEEEAEATQLPGQASFEKGVNSLRSIVVSSVMFQLTVGANSSSLLLELASLIA
jgi:hypothetical protein